jgi:lipoprotein-anchoring transpeptidase ErfK/SrfK
MHRASLPLRITALIASLLLFAAAGGGAVAVADDWRTREILPPGSTIAGVDVSGMTRQAAREHIARDVAAPLADPITVRHGDRSFTLDAASMVAVDVDAMVETAFQPRAASTLAERVAGRFAERESGGSSDLSITLDESALATWLERTAASIETTAADAALALETDTIVVRPSRTGVSLDTTATAEILRSALTNGQRAVQAVVRSTEPTTTEADLGPAILVDISERRLYLYERGALAKTYGVAVGTPGHPTPRGEFEITQKRYMPTWGNPGSAWAANMPSYIGPGPNNPLGTRALNLNVGGIRIHGTNIDSSIGTAASHGCMRMHRWDIEELYERVDVGTPVYVVR